MPRGKDPCARADLLWPLGGDIARLEDPEAVAAVPTAFFDVRHEGCALSIPGAADVLPARPSPLPGFSWEQKKHHTTSMGLFSQHPPPFRINWPPLGPFPPSSTQPSASPPPHRQRWPRAAVVRVPPRELGPRHRPPVRHPGSDTAPLPGQRGVSEALPPPAVGTRPQSGRPELRQLPHCVLRPGRASRPLPQN